MISVVCPACKSQLKAKDTLAGRVVPCPKCGNQVCIPGGPAPAPTPLVPASAALVTPNEPAPLVTPAPRTSSAAVWSLVLAILAWLCLGPLTGIPAIICGHLARRRIKRSNGALQGAGMALAGLILAYIPLVTGLVIVGLLLFGVMSLPFLAGPGGERQPPSTRSPVVQNHAFREAAPPLGLQPPQAAWGTGLPGAWPPVANPESFSDPRRCYRGAAFVVTPEGHLLTCAHVVSGAAKTIVSLASRDHEAAVLGVDEHNDLALLKISANGLPTVQLSANPSPSAGAAVIVFGSSLTAHSKTELRSADARTLGMETKMVPMLHLDAPLNPGFTGGPVVDRHGNVIAVFSAKASGATLSSGSYAVPTQAAVSLLRSKGVTYASGDAPIEFEPELLSKRVLPAVAEVSIVPSSQNANAWEPARPKPLWKQEIGALALSPVWPAVSPDGKLIAVADEASTARGEEHLIELRAADNGALLRTLAGHKSRVWCLAFSPDSQTLASAGADETVMLWDAQHGALRNVVNCRGSDVRQVAFSPAGDLVAGYARVSTGMVPAPSAVTFSQAASIPIWDARTGKLKHTVKPSFQASQFAFRPKSNWLVVAGSAAGPGGACLGVWDASTGVCLNTLDKGQLCPAGLSQVPGQRDLALPTIPLYGDAMMPGSGGDVQSLAFSPDGQLLAIFVGKSVRVLDLDRSVLVRELSDKPLNWMKFSPDGRLLAFAYGRGFGGESLAIYDIASGSRIWDLRGEVRQPFAFLPDGKGLLSTPGGLELWDVSFLNRMGQPLPQLPPLEKVASLVGNPSHLLPGKPGNPKSSNAATVKLAGTVWSGSFDQKAAQPSGVPGFGGGMPMGYDMFAGPATIKRGTVFLEVSEQTQDGQIKGSMQWPDLCERNPFHGNALAGGAGIEFTEERPDGAGGNSPWKYAARIERDKMTVEWTNGTAARGAFQLGVMPSVEQRPALTKKVWKGTVEPDKAPAGMGMGMPGSAGPMGVSTPPTLILVIESDDNNRLSGALEWPSLGERRSVEGFVCADGTTISFSEAQRGAAEVANSGPPSAYGGMTGLPGMPGLIAGSQAVRRCYVGQASSEQITGSVRDGSGVRQTFQLKPLPRDAKRLDLVKTSWAGRLADKTSDGGYGMYPGYGQAKAKTRADRPDIVLKIETEDAGEIKGDVRWASDAWFPFQGRVFADGCSVSFTFEAKPLAVGAPGAMPGYGGAGGTYRCFAVIEGNRMIGTWTDGARQGKLLLQSTGMQRWTPLFPTAAEPSAGPPVDLSGQWKGSQGKDNWAVELLLFQRQNEVTGSWRVTIQATSQEFALDEGGFDPGTRKLSFRLQVPGRPAPVLVTGTLAAEGNSIAGTFVTGQGSGSWQVARESQAKVPGNPLREAEKFQQAIGMLEPVR